MKADFIRLEDIEDEDRQRLEYDADTLGELAESIELNGLIHAIFLRDGKRLVCGGRRKRAVELLYKLGKSFSYLGQPVPPGTIPFVNQDSLTEIQAKELELEENLRRDNLTPQDEARAKAELHKLRLSQNPAQTKQDTAKELIERGIPATTTDVRDALLIAENLDDPAVAKAKSKKEAMKVIRKKKEVEHNKRLAEEFKEEITKDVQSWATVIHGSLTTELRRLPQGTFDLILADPPYGIDAHNFNNQEGNAHTYDDTYENFVRIIRDIAHVGFQLTKPDAHLYLFHDNRNWQFIVDTLSAAGWDVWPRPLIWAKGKGLLPVPDYGPRLTYEPIVYARKGKKKTRFVAPDILNYAQQQTERGAEKPVDLYENLILRSCSPGQHVLDPCFGTGPTFLAGLRANVKVTGIEVDENAVGIALRRIKDASIDGEEIIA